MGRVLPLAAAAALALRAIGEILYKTSGEPAVPLDDAFIHFQFARSIVERHPLVYTPGTEPVPGATSLLWPLVLSGFYAGGFRDLSLIWAAWGLGFACLGLLAFETWQLARGLTTEESAFCAGLMVLAFAGYTWFAASGMEVLPFAWLATRTTRRAAEWNERAPLAGTSVFTGGQFQLPSGIRGLRVELCALSWLTPLMRPEGALLSVLAALSLFKAARGRSRAAALVALLGPVLPSGINWLLTHQALNTTAVSKWLLLSPYQYGGRVASVVTGNIHVLLETLLDGQVWSAIFLPSGAGLFAWLALPALVFSGFRSGQHFRAFAVLLLALGIFIPTTYESFLWNRLRYLWPFVPAWFIGLSALGDVLGLLGARIRPELAGLRWLFGGFCVGALASRLSPALHDLATSADAIRRQQVALGRWAHDALPKDASIGVNDTGAIAYLSERRTFDVVGLTTKNEARYWAHGAGSRFEHYEKLPKSALPSHFIVYPEWFAVSPLLGRPLTERSVPGATILGGETMIAYTADYSKLGSGEAPAEPVPGRLRDQLDVADVESEAAHGYELYAATQQDDRVGSDNFGLRVDGGRSRRTVERFTLNVAPGGLVVARLAASGPLSVKVLIAHQSIGDLALAGGAWDEVSIRLPGGIPAGPQAIELSAPSGRSFTAFHYWSYGPE